MKRDPSVPKRATVVTLLAQVLANDLQGRGRESLPPLAALAKAYGVSYRTMLAAMHILRRQGGVAISQGKRGRVLDPRMRGPAGPPPPGPAPMSSAERVYAALMDDIRSGKHRIGDSLPKKAFLAAHFGVSHRTLSAALGKLARAGVLHQKSRSWVIGPRRSDNQRPAPRALVLVYMPTLSTWQGICGSERTRRFGQNFVDQSLLHAVDILLAAPEGAGGASDMPILTGSGALRRALLAAGPRYRGALILGKGPQYHDFAGEIAGLRKLGKPVLWLDAAGEGIPPSTKVRPNAVCAYSESALVACAISLLRERGHKVAAYSYNARTDWEGERGRLLVEAGAAAESPVEMRLAPLLDHHGDWLQRPRDRVLPLIRKLWFSGAPGAKEDLGAFKKAHATIRALVGNTPYATHLDSDHGEFIAYSAWFLARAGSRDRRARMSGDLHPRAARLWDRLRIAQGLFDKPVTCLVFPNDMEARHAFPLIREMSVFARREISVLSFDNAFGHTLFPLTSVDPGFALLGYHAFHALLGDLPVPRTRTGIISARPFIADGGSVRDLIASRKESAIGPNAVRPNPGR